MRTFKKIFFVGIKGVGMAALAALAKQALFEVCGSDVSEEFITDKILKKENIKIFEGFDTKVIKEVLGDTKPDDMLVIVTGAHGGMENPQVKYARELGIRGESYGRALGMFMEGEVTQRSDLKGISVAGCHGKTTISAMIAHCLGEFGVDPSYVIGTSEIFPLGSAGHYGAGVYFVAEADEYVADPLYDLTPKFLYQKPYAAIINNIELDHPDVFKNIDEVVGAYINFAKGISKNGILVINAMDQLNWKVVDQIGKDRPDIRIVTFGDCFDYDFWAYPTDYIQNGFETEYLAYSNKTAQGEFEVKIPIPGFHNAYNSLAAVALLSSLEFPLDDILNALGTFTGTKRRLERVGYTKGGAAIVDDYAHHPTEIKATLKTIREAFPNKKIICVFQPHTFSRTQALFDEFCASFSKVDTLILVPTFASMRKEQKSSETDKKLFRALGERRENVHFFKTFDFVVEYLDSHADSDKFVILTMGAGDVYKIAYALLHSSVKGSSKLKT